MFIKELIQNLNQGINNKVSVATSLPAAGSITVETQAYPEYLITHAFVGISYAEWMKIIGTVYILLMCAKIIIPAIKNTFQYITSKFKTKC